MSDQTVQTLARNESGVHCSKVGEARWRGIGAKDPGFCGLVARLLGSMLKRLSRRERGLVLALVTAVVSGFAVFFNGYGVRAWADVADPTSYTTFKNAIAAAIILAVGALVGRGAKSSGQLREHPSKALWLIPVVGGSIPFVLFFEGLARAQSTQAAMIHKTLLVWVAALAVVFLRERLSWPHYGAIGLLVVGQLTLAGGPGGFAFGAGEVMILAATLLWSVEVVLSKHLLASVSSTRLSRVRMVGGSLVLVGYSVLRGAQVNLNAMSFDHLVWVVVAGLFLSAYVLSWHAALDRAPAVDVTAVLVLGGVITGLLQTGVRGLVLPNPAGVGLILAGAVIVLRIGFRKSAHRR